jgi:hypothetical protein
MNHEGTKARSVSRVGAWLRGAGIAGSIVAMAAASAGCGGSKDSVGVAHGPNDVNDAQIDADPMALLPSSPVVVASVDARAFFTSEGIGPQVARMSEKLIPIGDEAGFSASRDVDKVIAAAYSMQGVDVAAAISGRFDAQKIDQAAQAHTPTKGGGLIVSSQYAGRTLYTVNNVGFTILTPKTALAGTETGIRRALDRIKDGRVKRDFAPWIIATLETPGAELAVAADFVSQPLASASVGVFPLPWLQGMQMARILGDFKAPGMSIAGTLTYAEEAQASAGADGVRQAGNLANVVAMTGLTPQIKNLQVAADKKDVKYTLSVDDQSLRGLFAAMPSWIH